MINADAKETDPTKKLSNAQLYTYREQLKALNKDKKALKDEAAKVAKAARALAAK